MAKKNAKKNLIIIMLNLLKAIDGCINFNDIMFNDMILVG